MQRMVLLSGALSFVMAFAGGTLAFSVMMPRAAEAQAAQMQAQAYVLLGPDGSDRGALESTLNPQGEPISTLRLTQNGALRVRMETGRNGPDAAALTLRDRLEQIRIRLALASAQPGAVDTVDAMDIFDQDQHVRIHIGVDSAGAPFMQMLDADGNVTWSAH